MTYTIKKLPKSQIEVDITLLFEEFKPYLEQAAVLISEETDFEGFRRGKAPYAIIKERMGEGKIYERAAHGAVQKTYPRILQDVIHDLKNGGEETEVVPIGNPEIKVMKLAPENPFEYKVIVSFLPSVTLPDYKNLSLQALRDKKHPETSDEEVEKAVLWIRESRAPIVTVARPAERGDRVEITFEVEHEDVKLSQANSQNHPLTIGKNTFLPGFEDALIGMKAGDVKNFSLRAPENWHEKSLAGKMLDFTVAMKLVQERKIPELNDAFIKSIGAFESIDSFTKSVREGIMREKEEKERERIRGKIIEDIEKNSRIDVPDVLIAAEEEKMLSDFKKRIGEMGMKWEDHLAHIKKTEDGLKDDWKKDAEKRVRASLCLREIAKKEHIEVSQEEVEERANQYLRQFETPEEVSRAIDPEELKEYTKGVIRNEKVFTLLETL